MPDQVLGWIFFIWICLHKRCQNKNSPAAFFSSFFRLFFFLPHRNAESDKVCKIKKEALNFSSVRHQLCICPTFRSLLCLSSVCCYGWCDDASACFMLRGKNEVKIMTFSLQRGFFCHLSMKTLRILAKRKVFCDARKLIRHFLFFPCSADKEITVRCFILLLYACDVHFILGLETDAFFDFPSSLRIARSIFNCKFYSILFSFFFLQGATRRNTQTEWNCWWVENYRDAKCGNRTGELKICAAEVVESW